MNIYQLYKNEYSERQWHDMIRFVEGLPELCDMLDRDGEILEEYDHRFNVDRYDINHDSLRIDDYQTLRIFLAETTLPKKMCKAILEPLDNNTIFQLAGDGGGLGFILDVWEDQSAKERSDDPIEMYTIWFEDYLTEIN